MQSVKAMHTEPLKLCIRISSQTMLDPISSQLSLSPKVIELTPPRLSNGRSCTPVMLAPLSGK